MCFVRISEQTAIISLYSVKRPVFITEMVFTARYGLNLYAQFRLILFFHGFMNADASNTRKCGTWGDVLGEREYRPTVKMETAGSSFSVSNLPCQSDTAHRIQHIS